MKVQILESMWSRFEIGEICEAEVYVEGSSYLIKRANIKWCFYVHEVKVVSNWDIFKIKVVSLYNKLTNF